MVKKKKMRDPLRHRYLRELRGDLAKYLVLLLLLTFSIGFVSGFLVADNSMISTYNESFEKYNIEYGHFRTKSPLNRAGKRAIEAAGVRIHDLFYTECRLESGAKLRIYPERTQVNKVCLMEGAAPAAEDEIAIDRMFADNSGLKVGDTIRSGDRQWKITGLAALSDYSCLFENNSDSMFDAVAFSVGIVTKEAFEGFSEDGLEYCYAWTYLRQPSDDIEEKAMADSLKPVVRGEASLLDYVPRYANKAIQFTGDDMGGDKAMMMVLLYIIMVIIAFVFGITISNTIAKEAGVIGTLRASGYTRGELLRHYAALPLAVTFVSAILGNVMGYTFMKEVCAAMYYGSYSLPTYVTRWNSYAFVHTTAEPMLIVLVVTVLILWWKLRLSPIKFLRRDLKRKKQRRAMPLSPKLRIFARFRLRVIFQNRANYLMMIIGIFFANVLLLFGMGLPDMLNSYMNSIGDNMIAKYQYILTVPEEADDLDHQLNSLVAMMMFAAETQTDNETAEAFSAWTLRTPPGDLMEEDVMLYGLKPEGRYVDLSPADGEVYVSSAYAKKYSLSPGDTFRLLDHFEEKEYSFTVTGIYSYDSSITVFMNQKTLNEIMGQDEAFFAGYFSETEITDIDEKYIGSVIDFEALTKISRQLMVSFGDMASLVNIFALIMFVILVFLLSKIIIEKNAHAISMTKILGYSNGEIDRLYVAATSIVVVAAVIATLPLVKATLTLLVEKMMFTRMTGWIPVSIYPVTMVKIAAMAIAVYAVVAVLEIRRIRRIPMDEALKNVE